ncbi:MAG: PAS domain-containing protein, partial [Pseudomonadota bacterium]
MTIISTTFKKLVPQTLGEAVLYAVVAVCLSAIAFAASLPIAAFAGATVAAIFLGGRIGSTSLAPVQLLERVDAAVLVSKADGTISFANSPAEKLLDMLSHDLIGKNVSEVVPAEVSRLSQGDGPVVHTLRGEDGRD